MIRYFLTRSHICFRSKLASTERYCFLTDFHIALPLTTLHKIPHRFSVKSHHSTTRHFRLGQIMNIPQGTASTDTYRIIQDHISSPDPSSDDSLSRACAVLTDRITSIPTESTEDEQHGLFYTEISKLWCSILLAASASPHDSPTQDHLVTLLSHLRLEQVTKNGKVIEFEDAKIWTDLPIFGLTMRECWNVPLDQEISPETKSKWINVNAFVARITAASKLASIQPLDFSLYGIWMMRSGLEDMVSDGNTGEATVGVAAVWILYAGKSMRTFSKEGKEFPRAMGRAGLKVKDKEWKGYNEERWKFWEQEFGNVLSIVEDEKVNMLVKQALDTMKQS